jgi:hypothetical protein
MINHIQMIPTPFTFKQKKLLDVLDASILIRQSTIMINGESINIARVIGNMFVIPLVSVRSYADNTPVTLEKLCNKLSEEKEQNCKALIMSSIKVTKDTTLSDLCKMILDGSKLWDNVELYLYSKSGRVVHITYQKNKDDVASAASPFRPRRRGSNSVKRHRKLSSKSKSRTKSKTKSVQKNVGLEKFWRKLASGKIAIVYKNGSFKITSSDSPTAKLKIQYDAFDKDPNVVAVLASPMSSDAYDGLYKRAKDSSVEDVVKNYKKFFKPSEKTPKDMIKKGYPEMKKVYYPKL